MERGIGIAALPNQVIDDGSATGTLTLEIRNISTRLMPEVENIGPTEIVILLGSPPKLATCRCSHSKDARWSCSPALAVPSFINVPEARKPSNPNCEKERGSLVRWAAVTSNTSGLLGTG